MARFRLRMISDEDYKLTQKLEKAKDRLVIISSSDLVTCEESFNLAYSSFWSDDGPGVVIIKNVFNNDDEKRNDLLKRSVEVMCNFYADSEGYSVVLPTVEKHYLNGDYVKALSVLEFLRNGKSNGNASFSYKRKPPVSDKSRSLTIDMPVDDSGLKTHPTTFTYAPTYGGISRYYERLQPEIINSIDRLCLNPKLQENNISMMRPFDNVKIAYNGTKKNAKQLDITNVNQLPTQTKSVPTKFHSDNYPNVERYQAMLCVNQGSTKFTVVPGFYKNDDSGFTTLNENGSYISNLIEKYGIAVDDGDIILWKQGIVHGDAFYSSLPDSTGLFRNPSINTSKTYPSGDFCMRILVGPVYVPYPTIMFNFLMFMADNGFLPESYKGWNINIPYLSDAIINRCGTRYRAEYIPSNIVRDLFNQLYINLSQK